MYTYYVTRRCTPINVTVIRYPWKVEVISEYPILQHIRQHIRQTITSFVAIRYVLTYITGCLSQTDIRRKILGPSDDYDFHSSSYCPSKTTWRSSTDGHMFLVSRTEDSHYTKNCSIRRMSLFWSRKTTLD